MVLSFLVVISPAEQFHIRHDIIFCHHHTFLLFTGEGEGEGAEGEGAAAAPAEGEGEGEGAAIEGDTAAPEGEGAEGEGAEGEGAIAAPAEGEGEVAAREGAAAAPESAEVEGEGTDVASPSSAEAPEVSVAVTALVRGLLNTCAEFYFACACTASVPGRTTPCMCGYEYTRPLIPCEHKPVGSVVLQAAIASLGALLL